MRRFYVKKTLLPLFFSVIFFGGYAQDISQKYAELHKISADKYEKKEDEVLIQMHYGKYDILNPEVIGRINPSEVKRVTLVYTDHPQGLSFKTLNTNRLKALQHLFPQLFGHEGVDWQILKQTFCPSKAVAAEYFHGFALTVSPTFSKPPPSVSPPPIKEQPLPDEPPANFNPSEQTTGAPIDLVREEEKQHIKPPLSPIPQEFKSVLKKIPKKDWRYIALGKDSISFKVFERNHDQWATYLVTVSDWTASMYPYTTQILRWHLQNQKESKIKHFVFFNDGDKKRNNEKKKGKIGGIYSIESTSIPEIVNMMKLVKSRGDGGDLEENDIEALVWAAEKHPLAEAFTLIADNKSEVRDMSLMGKLRKPVHIILGRLPEQDFALLNLQYIDLALKTKGSVHTFEQDFYGRKALSALKKRVKSLRNEMKKK